MSPYSLIIQRDSGTYEGEAIGLGTHLANGKART